MKKQQEHQEEVKMTDTLKITYFKTKNGKDWMPGERYKVVISPLSERVKAPKGFVRISDWTETFIPAENSYDWTEDMETGYITFQGNIGFFPPTNFIYPKTTEVLE